MKRFDLWKLSVLNVLSTPVRSLLTVLGFAIGVAAILAVITLGEAGKREVEREMGRLGIDKIWVTASNGSTLQSGMSRTLERITGGNAAELAYLPAEIFVQNGKSKSVTLCGCERAYLNGISIVEGRLPGPAEWQKQSSFVLAGETLAGELELKVGDYLTVYHQMYEIYGIIGSSQGVSSVDLDQSLLMPIDAVMRMTEGKIHEIQVAASPNATVQTTQRLVRQALDHIGADAETSTLEVQMEAASSVIRTFVNVLKWVAIVCVLAGGIGVMNILLVNVRERKREIGVMKSLGTTPCQICTLFLLEALTYAVIGGLSGIALGITLIYAAGKSIQLSAAAGAGECACVFAAALAVGLLFGVLPAFRASMLNCVDALRQE